MKHSTFNDPDADLRPSTVSAAAWRAMASADRVAAIKAAYTPPAACGPDVVVAPARGAFRTYDPIGLVPGSTERVRSEAHRGEGEAIARKGVAVVDVFDRMMVEAARRNQPAPLTPSQISIGRRYRWVAEQHDAGGFKMSSINSTGGGTGAMDVMDLRLAERKELVELRRRVGVGVAMKVRRVRPSQRGTGARVIHDIDVIDRVCLGDLTVTEVLREFGWSTYSGNTIALRAALCGSLSRMIGYWQN